MIKNITWTVRGSDRVGRVDGIHVFTISQRLAGAGFLLYDQLPGARPLTEQETYDSAQQAAEQNLERFVTRMLS